MVTHIYWDWEDFGVAFRIYKNEEYSASKHKLSIDIQIAWFCIWLEVIKRKNGIR
jgi:hypothetical protein